MASTTQLINLVSRQRVNQEVTLLRGLPGVGFKLTPDGQYDVRGKVYLMLQSLQMVVMPPQKNMSLRKFKKLGSKYLNRLILL